MSDALDQEIYFDFDSFVRGEAKLCGCVRERCFINAGAVGAKLCCPAGLVAEGFGAIVAGMPLNLNDFMFLGLFCCCFSNGF